jgi:hypothetical protein
MILKIKSKHFQEHHKIKIIINSKQLQNLKTNLLEQGKECENIFN